MRLSRQAALVTLAVASVAVLLTGAVAFGLIRGAGEGETQRVLGRQADQVAAVAERTTGPGRRAGEAALRVPLRRQQIRLIEIFSAGTTSPSPAAPLTSADIEAVEAGQGVSAIRSDAGTRYFVEARATASIGGGIALVQPTAEARSVTAPLQRRLLVALLIGLAGAAVAGALLARRLARPLGEAARAAHALAGGDRDVRVAPRGAAEVAELAQSLNVPAEALRFSEDRQRTFLLSVSHELRTPLTAIEGFAEALADGVTTGQDVPAAGAVVLAEAQRLERLVRDLLDLARLGAHDFHIDLAPVELTDLVRAAGRAWGPRAAAGQVELRVEAPAQQVVAVTDAVRIRQILDGLADNALRVVGPGAPIVFALKRDERDGLPCFKFATAAPV